MEVIRPIVLAGMKQRRAFSRQWVDSDNSSILGTITSVAAIRQVRRDVRPARDTRMDVIHLERIRTKPFLAEAVFTTIISTLGNEFPDFIGKPAAIHDAVFPIQADPKGRRSPLRDKQPVHQRP